MTIYGAITTISAGFIFAFVINFAWGAYAKVGVIGGIVAAGMIVGTMWMLDHGIGFIVQGVNAPWVDQAWAAGIGLLTAGFCNKGKFKKTVPTLIIALLAGIAAGFILSCLGK